MNESNKNPDAADQEHINQELSDNSTARKNKQIDAFSIGSLVIIIGVLIFFNFEFRTPIISGFICAVLTYPIFTRLTNFVHKLLKDREILLDVRSLVATVVVLTVSVVAGVLLLFIGGRLTIEVQEIYKFLSSSQNLQSLTDFLRSYGVNDQTIKLAESEFQNRIEPFMQNLLSFDNLSRVVDIGQQAVNILITQIVYLIIFLITWSNALLFGQTWINTILHLFSFHPKEIVTVKKNLILGIRNVIYANLLSGVLNAVAVLLIMSIFGIPNIFVVTIFMFMLGFLPLTPSEFGYLIPLTVIFQTNPIAAIILAIICELFILWQNYVFLPKIVLTGTQGNPLFIITSVLTAMVFFGIMGFIIGPVIMIFTNTLGNILLARLNIDQKLKTAS